MNPMYRVMWVTEPKLDIGECAVIHGSFSKIFDKKGKRLIGLNEVGVSSGLPGLANRIIFEKSHKIGKYDSLSSALHE